MWVCSWNAVNSSQKNAWPEKIRVEFIVLRKFDWAFSSSVVHVWFVRSFYEESFFLFIHSFIPVLFFVQFLLIFGYVGVWFVGVTMTASAAMMTTTTAVAVVFAVDTKLFKWYKYLVWENTLYGWVCAWCTIFNIDLAVRKQHLSTYTHTNKRKREKKHWRKKCTMKTNIHSHLLLQFFFLILHIQSISSVSR